MIFERINFFSFSEVFNIFIIILSVWLEMYFTILLGLERRFASHGWVLCFMSAISLLIQSLVVCAGFTDIYLIL